MATIFLDSFKSHKSQTLYLSSPRVAEKESEQKYTLIFFPILIVGLFNTDLHFKNIKAQ
jgi:hypothetical protein